MTFGGLPTRWEPEGTSRGLALVAPGRAYAPSAPLLDLARALIAWPPEGDDIEETR